jgi:non-ribosomal peptide synthase protein (TIGR01720 family)
LIVESNKTLGYHKILGNFAINIPILMELSKLSIGDGLIELDEKLKSLPFHGLGYDWVLEDLVKEGLYPDNLLTSYRINYLGRLKYKTNENFKLDPKTFGQRVKLSNTRLTIDIEIHFFIFNDNIEMQFTYSTNKFDAMFIEKLGNKYLECLDEIIFNIK